MTEHPRQASSPHRSLQDDCPAQARACSPSGLQRRGLSAATYGGTSLSDSVETRYSVRPPTDDFFFQRVREDENKGLPIEDSHWQSAPLVLALLPAIAGVFFKNGNAVVTDVTLLILAAVFLNWSVRLPWNWYRSAQGIRQQESDDYDVDSPAAGPETEFDDMLVDSADEPEGKKRLKSAAASAASKELQMHELTALASCFIFPVVGTWLLHAIRSKLSRPSEGLVSNYNLTIFLLASEIRPFSHLLKIIQARTLHLQRIVASASGDENREGINVITLQDLSNRLEELEAHVAEASAARMSPASTGQEQSPGSDQATLNNLISQTTNNIRKTFQPEIDALNRAVRRYEKRTAVTTFQTESRLQELTTRVQDAIVLAGAAQRANSRYRPSFAITLLDWACAFVVFPTQITWAVVRLPASTVTWCLGILKLLFVKKSPQTQEFDKGKMPPTQTLQSSWRREKIRPMTPASLTSKQSKQAIYDIYE